MKPISKSKRIKINDMILEEYIADNIIIPLEFIKLISHGMKKDTISRLEYNDNNIIFEYTKVNNIKVIKVRDSNCNTHRGTAFLTNKNGSLNPFVMISNKSYRSKIFDIELGQIDINEKYMSSIIRQLEFYRKIGVLNGLD